MRHSGLIAVGFRNNCYRRPAHSIPNDRLHEPPGFRRLARRIGSVRAAAGRQRHAGAFKQLNGRHLNPALLHCKQRQLAFLVDMNWQPPADQKPLGDRRGPVEKNGDRTLLVLRPA